ncbi:hypothetical protein [Muricauda sp. MAR_2010_75]|uniref:hypothetical protein n=1 Tax=Allomuricauda sp. MAR_2010_75 TaxID=1250232 RepID=UPI0018CEBC49|nr:hypothetical protein [Muricauda sp. MAR_2010_75]
MKYKGMTINEALCEAGVEKDFYKAIEEKDKKKVVSILENLGLNESSIKPIIEEFKL